MPEVGDEMADNNRYMDIKQLNSAISALYDALPGAAVTEDAARGQLGATGLAVLFVSQEGERPRDRAKSCRSIDGVHGNSDYSYA